jgi:hypothetical protein
MVYFSDPRPKSRAIAMRKMPLTKFRLFIKNALNRKEWPVRSKF